MKRFGDTARLALLLASVAAAPFALCAPAYGQDDVAEEEELIVTARRTAESLQDVPASVSAFTEDHMERLGAIDATGLQGAVPNLNIVQGRGSSNATNIYIRGIGQPDALQTFDPAIGFYVDGVYYSRIRGTQMELFDIERVEVLRGPQGTLYGKNTIGGAYSIITRRPDQDPNGLFQVTIGDYGQLEARVAASGPLTDTLAVGGALFGATRDGYVTNPVTGEEYNDRNAWGGRFQAALDVTPDFSLDFAADYTEEDNALVMGQATNTLTHILGFPLLPLPPTPPEFAFTATPTPGLPNSTELTHWGASMRASWELNDNWTLRSITAHRDLENTDYVDIDATALEIGDVLVDVAQDQFSQELQAIYESERFTMVSGLYYLRENIVSHQEAYADDFVTGFALPSPPFPANAPATSFLRTVDDDLETTSWAAYLNGTFALTDRLNASVGVRYTEESKDYLRTTSTFSNNIFLIGTFAFQDEETWENVSPMVSLDYEVSDDVLLYGRVAQGFKSGGFNGRANNPGEDQPYDPETVTSYEIGAKTDWWDNMLRANVAVFYNDYRDFQARVSRSVVSDTQPVPAIDFAVLNAGGLEIYGAELELSANPVENLTLDAQIGYLHAEYTEFIEVRNLANPAPPPATIPTAIDRSFQEPAFSPEWTARFGAAYEFDLGGAGALTLAGSARYRSSMALAVDNSNIFTGVEFPGMHQDEYWLYDASLTWEATDVLSVALIGRNLSDEVYRTDAQEFSSVGGIRTAYYGAPQTWSVVFTARY